MEIERINKILIKVLNKLDENKSNRQMALTGYAILDSKLSGFQNSNLMVVASKPGMGKSSFALNIAVNVITESSTPVLIFNLESSKQKVCQDILLREAMITEGNMSKGNFTNSDEERMARAIIKISKMPIHISDKPAITIQEIENYCRKFKEEQGIGLVIIDYFQLVSYKDRKCIGKRLKELADELNINILVVSQLSKEPQERLKRGESPRPTINDFANNYLIQYADIVMLLYRDEIYFPESKDKNLVDVIIAKNRFGECGTVQLKYLPQYRKFENLENSLN